jgi:tetratricopeptide (TPR) repeat protein
VRTQDYFWALGVTRAAATEEIDHAYEALARTFHADGYCNSPDDDRQMAQEIFDRLSEAHNVLRDPAQRRAYAEAIDRLNAEGIDRLNAEGIDRLNAEGIDRLNAEGIDRPDAEGIDRPDAEGTRSRANDGGGAAPATGATVPTSAGNAAATALYDSGMEHLKARRHHEAVEAFRQAARLVPGEADFRAALGWSLFREAPADARAGRAALGELRRALQIDSRNLRALHFLASFYAETGQPDLAIDELEKILQIAPNAPSADEAADRLRRLRQR